MKKLKLSAVYIALCTSGLALFSMEAFSCEREIINQKNLECKSTAAIYTDIEENTYFYNIKNSSVKFNDSRIGFNSKDTQFIHNVIEADNSNLHTNNTFINLSAKYGSLIKLKNSTGNIEKSILDLSQENTAIELDQSKVTISDSQLRDFGDQGTAFSFTNTNNTIELNKSKVQADLFLDYLVSLQDKVVGGKVIIDNSEIDSNLLALAGDNNSPESNNDANLEEKYDFIVNNNSKIKGALSIVSDEKSINPTINLTLNNSVWNATNYTEDNTTYYNRVKNLTLDNGIINIEKVAGYQNLTIDNLSGSGIFTLNTDLANQQSDQIIINGLVEGSHKLDVKDSGNEPQAANGKVTLVKTSGNGEAQFSLLNRDYVDAGAYRYRLSKEQNDWVLSNKQAEPTKPVEPTKPTETVKPVEPVKPTETLKPVEPTKPAETVKPVDPVKPAETSKPVEPTKPTETVKPVDPVKPTETAKPAEPVKPAETAKPTETAKPEATQTSSNKVMLSGTSNALASLRQAQLLQLEQGLVGIHQRLGEQEQVGNLGVWVRNINNRSEFASTSTTSNSNTSGFEQDSHQIQVGVETALSNNWRVGGFVENSRSKIDFNGEYGSGKVKGQGVGLILTYQGNGGFYLDNIAKYSRLKATSGYTNSQRYHAYSLSSEIGKAFELGKFTLTPNAQLAWHSLSGKVNEDRLSSLYARVGARLATTFDMASWKLQPYFEINGISSKNRSSQVRVNQYAFDVASSRGRVENALGLNIAKGQHRFGVEAKTAYGKRLDQPFALQAVYRYQW